MPMVPAAKKWMSKISHSRAYNIPLALPRNQECIAGMFLVQGRCEAKCPVKWYQSVNSEAKPICLPCHYTCLTCAGGEDGHCTTCYDEAVPVRSGLSTTTPSSKLNFTSEADEMRKFDSYIRVEDLPVESHLSYGRRRVKRGVTKKILEPFDKPRTLYYCYPSKLVSEAESSKWYYRMTVLFGVNILLLFALAGYFLFIRFRKNSPGNTDADHLSYRYVRMKNGETGSIKKDAVEMALYLSSSSSEEE